MQQGGRLANSLRHAVGSVRASSDENRPAPDQVGNAVAPRAQRPERPEYDEPENDGEQAIIGLYADSFLDTMNPLELLLGNLALDNRSGGLFNAHRVPGLNGGAILVYVFADVLRPQREKQHDDGKRDIGKTE
jgi:hypothetical protein